MQFFTWFRERVRQAVLLGVSDAVEDLGDLDELRHNDRQQMLEVLRGPEPIRKIGSRSKSKRLGKTLAETSKAA